MLINGIHVPIEDTICLCGHWYDEHDNECLAPNCQCAIFTFSAEDSTPAAIADRGGDPAQWPKHVKDAINDED